MNVVYIIFYKMSQNRNPNLLSANHQNKQTGVNQVLCISATASMGLPRPQGK